MRAALCLALLCAAAPVLAGQPAAGDVTFERDVRPILKAHCIQCHGEAGEHKGNLDLRLRRLLAAGGDSGPAFVESKPDESLILDRVKAGEMPPKGKPLAAQEIATLERWIAAGAPTAGPEPDQPDAAVITAEERAFWAFQPIRRPALPAVSRPDLIRNPVDAFLLASLEKQSLTLSPETDKTTLIRRATFDLLGLPPTPDEVAAFLADESPDAYEKLIDRLLASPYSGERWGRHWLDVAGYSDSDGVTPEDPVRPYAYKFRDYVIRSLNADKPFDQFLVEQLAGDELVPQPYANLTPEQTELLIATGFLRMAPDGTAAGADKVATNAVVAETIKVVSTSLLGLTVGCAECHDHRYDPIPQTDYYRLRAIFEPALNWKAWRPPGARLISLYTDAERAKAAEIETEAQKILTEREKKQAEFVARTFEREVEKLPAEKRDPARAARNAAADKRTPEQQQLLKEYPSLNVDGGSLYLYDKPAADEVQKEYDRAQAVRATKPVEEFVSILNEMPGQTPETVVFRRGDPDQPLAAVAPGELSILAAPDTSIAPHDAALPTTGRRLAYARWLTSGRHPLVPRVLVNRVWMHHFGRGLVATPSDFGRLGERPTHPELLDWLADEFVKRGWSLKQLHRMLMTSAAYRQSSLRHAAGEAADPDNRLLWRMPVRRLEAEAVRDAILTATGRLTPKLFGPPVPVMQDEVGQIVVGQENLNGENRPGDVIPLHGEEYRRSLYIQVRRSRPLAVLETFDLPAMEPNCELRNFSTVTPQSLLLLNSDFMAAAAADLATRVANDAGEDPGPRVTRLWQLALARPPRADEAQRAAAFLIQQTAQFTFAATASPPAEGQPAPTPPAQRALTLLGQALLSANEFLYVD